MRYAIIENSIVVNVAMANAPMAPNWIQSDVAGIGWTYVNGVLAAPVPPPVPPTPPDHYLWLIDIGPYMDRFGAAKMAVLTSADVNVKAIVQDMLARKYIDLKRTDVAQGLAYIGSVVPALTGAIQTAILTTPVSAADNLALRKLYFS